MKRTIFAAYLALLITAFTAFCLVWRSGGEHRPQPEPGTSPSPVVSPTPAPGPSPTPEPAETPAPTEEAASSDP